VENTLSFLGQSFFSSFRLEIAASAVKFFGAGENVAFPLKMNFDSESDLKKRGHTKKNIYFHFLGLFGGAVRQVSISSIDRRQFGRTEFLASDG
jgi:hypothetical protein